MQLKRCNYCQKELPLECFGNRVRESGNIHPLGHCKKCNTLKARKRSSKIKFRVITVPDLKGESWIPFENGRYVGSNLGRVKSITKTNHQSRELILPGTLSKKGYLMVNVGKYRPIHRIICTLFNPNPLNKPEVNHIDTDKTNNKADNLEWLTFTEHRKHTLLHKLNKGPRGEKHPHHKLKERQVLAIFNSNQHRELLAVKYKVSLSLIDYIKMGKIWGHLTGKEYKKVNTVLSKDQVLAVFNSNDKNSEIANKYNVSLATVTHIKSGRNGSRFTGKIFKKQYHG